MNDDKKAIFEDCETSDKTILIIASPFILFSLVWVIATAYALIELL